MRKVLSFVLVLSLVLGSFGMAFAAPMSDVAGKDFEDAVNVLTELGVINGYPDGTYKPANIVTRAEMAVIVVSALGLADYATGTANFKDMKGHWSNGFVAYANSLGIIAGYPDGTFKPDATVSYDEAATMLVAALGYNADSLVGTWPANFVTKAKTLGILDGIKSSAAGANRGDIATMTYQTLDQNIGKTDKDGVWAPTIIKTGTPNEYDRMLGRLGAEEKAGGAFVVRGTESATINLKPYVGAFVTAYVSDEKIIAIKEVKSEYLTGELKKGKFKADGVEYNLPASTDYTDGTTTGAINFANGAVSGAAVTTLGAVEYTLGAKVTGKTIEKIYSVSTWTVSASAQVEEDDLDSITSKTPKLLSQAFKLDKSNNIDLKSFELLGVDSLDKIKEDNIVYVYVGGGNITRIEVGTKVVTGVVEKISDGEFTINGAKYEDSEDTNATPSTFNVKDEVKLYLDYAGDIFISEKVKGTADKYAIVLDAKNGTEGTFGSVPKLELFLADGTSKVFEANAKKIDDAGIITTGSSQTWAVTTGAIIKYSVNTDGVLTGVTTAAPVTVTSTGSITAKDVSKAGYFDGFKIASDAVVFTVDSFKTAQEKDADFYGVTTADKLFGVKSVVAKYYEKDGIIKLIVMEASASSGDDVFGVYDSYTAETAKDPGWELRFLVDGSAVTYASEGEFDSEATTVGGLFVLKFNTDGELKGISNASGATDVSVATVSTATTITIKNNVATISASAITGSGVYNAIGSTQASISLASNVVVYKLNDSSKWIKGSVNDLKLTNSSKEVIFYDTVGKDKVADIVLVK